MLLYLVSQASVQAIRIAKIAALGPAVRHGIARNENTGAPSLSLGRRA
jgi:hypothetical protein